MKHKKFDHEYMLSRLNKTHFTMPSKHKIEAYFSRCKQLRDSYDYPAPLAREQAFNEELL